MNPSKRFHRAMSALMSAFLQGKLAKGDCHACAVGTICAASLGAEVLPVNSGNRFYWSVGEPFWEFVFTTKRGRQKIEPEYYKGTAKRQIDATGYSYTELARIEYAFETNTTIWHTAYDCLPAHMIDADQYRGLSAVVKVLCDIEGIADAAPYKILFDKPAILA